MATNSTLDCTATENFMEHIRVLRKQYNLILRLKESAEPLNKEKKAFIRTESGVVQQIDLLEKIVFLASMSKFYLGKPSDLSRKSDEPKEAAWVDEKPRYLCISNGAEMWCFDLKQGQDAAEQCDALLAVSAGLFKMGSDVYSIGGSNSCSVQSDMDDYYIDRYWSLCSSFCADVNGSSLETYRLSLADGGGARLVLTQCSDIGPLKQHKFWPIVENINGETHVIDSFLQGLYSPHPYASWFFSHEVLKDNKWNAIETIDYELEKEDEVGEDDTWWDHRGYYIFAHVVVGSRIYALSVKNYLMFNSEDREWEARPRWDDRFWRDPLSVQNVWHILELGIGRVKCVTVREFPLISSSSGGDKLYVVLAVLGDWNSYDGDCSYSTLTVAYLVSCLTGDVVCFQRMPRTSKPVCMRAGTIFKVDDEGKTMCVIVHGSPWNDDSIQFLYINTFGVEVLSENASAVERIWAGGRESGWPVEQDFIGLAVKDCYLVNTAGRDFYFPNMQACFL